MKKVNIAIDEEIVNKIQLKDFEMQASKDVIAVLLDTHTLDADAKLVASPVFAAYQKRLVEAKAAFERAKDEMITYHVDEELRKQILNWNLDYYSCTLTLQVQE